MIVIFLNAGNREVLAETGLQPVILIFGKGAIYLSQVVAVKGGVRAFDGSIGLSVFIKKRDKESGCVVKPFRLRPA